MSNRKPQMKFSIPFEYQPILKEILRIKYPKYFTGKLHPNFYQANLPTSQNSLLKLTKAIKRCNVQLCPLWPERTKSYEMYYFRNQRSAKSITYIEFGEYAEFQDLSRFQKKALKNYLQSQTKISDLSIEINKYNPGIHSLIQYWFRKLNKLRSLHIYNFVGEDETQFVNQFKQILKQVSNQLLELTIFGCSSYPIELVDEINLCFRLQKLNLYTGFSRNYQEDREKLSKLNLSNITSFSCDTVFRDPSIQIGFLKMLDKCQELCLSFDFSNEDNQNELEELCKLIPKKLRIFHIDSERGNLSTNTQYELLSQVTVEKKFVITYWEPNLNLNYSNIFRNKHNVKELQLSLQENYSKDLQLALLKFTNLSIFKLGIWCSNLKKTWPKDFQEFFKQVKLKELQISFSADCTDIQEFCQMIRVCIENSKNIKEIHIKQANVQIELIPVVKLFIELEQKSFFVQLFNFECPKGSLNEYFKYQFRRLRWGFK